MTRMVAKQLEMSHSYDMTPSVHDTSRRFLESVDMDEAKEYVCRARRQR